MIETSKKVLTWIAITAVVILAILALIGMVLLAFGVAWYVRTHDERSRG